MEKLPEHNFVTISKIQTFVDNFKLYKEVVLKLDMENLADYLTEHGDNKLANVIGRSILFEIHSSENKGKN